MSVSLSSSRSNSQSDLKYRAGTHGPCPVCAQATKGCSWSDEDNGFHLCRGEPSPEWKCVAEDGGDGFRGYRRIGDTRRGPTGRRDHPTIDWEAQAQEYVHAIKRIKNKGRLANLLGIPIDVFKSFPLIGWDHERKLWTFPECDGNERITSIYFRNETRVRGNLLRGPRGLMLPNDWRTRTGPVYIAEGASDTIALHAAGFRVVGRPNAGAGADLLAALLNDLPADTDVIVIQDNDTAGRNGARSVAEELARTLHRPVHVCAPPSECKDVREWLTHQDRTEKLWSDRGEELRDQMTRTAVVVDPPKIGPRVVLTPLAGHKARAVRWLVPRRFPEGKLVMLAGAPARGSRASCETWSPR